MPKKSLLDRINQKRNNTFIGREDFIESFIRNFESTDPVIIYNIYGQGGVGKSFLSHKLMSIADSKKCLTVYTDENVKTILEWMENVSIQFKSKDVELTEFDKRYKSYLQETKKLESDPEKPRGTFAGLLKSAGKGLIKEGKKWIPGGEIASEFIDTDFLISAVSEWADFARKKITNKDEVDLVLSPVKNLSPLFWQAINKGYGGDNKFICFFIDTFEETGNFFEQWLLDVLDGKHGNNIPENTIFIIAGRDELIPNKWSHLGNLLQRAPLEPFTEEEAQYYLTNNNIQDFAIRRDILHLSGRLPVLIAWLAESARTNPSKLEDVSETAVERFLKWIIDEDKKTIAIYLSLPRFFNKDTLSILLEDETKTKLLFDWILTQPFVQKKGSSWTYHKVVREQMLRYLRNRSKKEWEKLHDQLSNIYWQRQKDLSIPPSECYSHTEWLNWEQERIYHALCASPDRTFTGIIAQIVSIWYSRDINKSRQFAETLMQAGEDNNHEICKDWGLRILAALDFYAGNEELIALRPLIEKILQNGFVKNEDHKCFLYVALGIAIAYSEKENINKAIECFQIATDLKPDNYEAFNLLGSLYAIKGDDDKSIECFQKVIEIKPNDHEAFYAIGRFYTDKGDLEKAIKCYQTAVDLNPHYHEAFYSMGLIYSQIGEYNKGIEYYQKAIDITPDYDKAFFYMGLSFSHKGAYDDGIECYQKAIDINPDYHEAFYNIGLSYYNKSDNDRAIEFYQKAIEINPDYYEALYNLAASYYDKGDNDRAIEFYQKAINIRPSAYDTFNNIGLAYSKKGNNDKAIESYQTAIDIQPDYYEALYNMGAFYYGKGDNDRAIELYLKATSVRPNAYDAFNNMGLAYSKKGNNDKAIECYQKAINLKPDYNNAFYNTALAYSDKGDQTKAIECCQKVIEIMPNDQEAFYLMGLAYAIKGDNDKSIEYYQKGIKIKPDHGRTLRHLGYSYFQSGNLQNAEIHLAQSVQLGSNDFGNMNLGHVLLARKKQDEALAFYVKSIGAFLNKKDFWEMMKYDFKYLDQYGVTSDQYQLMLQNISLENIRQLWVPRK